MNTSPDNPRVLQTARRIVGVRKVATKNPAKRQELGSVEFKPTFCDDNKPIWQEFKLSKRLDSATPGSNFSTGLGLGVAVVIEKTAPGVLLHEGGSAYLRIDNAAVEFTSRTINDDVKV